MAAKTIQESVNDWMALAKAYDKAEREQGVTPYVIVSLRNKRTDEVLYSYDIPRELYWRYSWVIDWRAARLLCQQPKDGVKQCLDFYDKKTGLAYGFGSLISRLTSAKANATMATNKLAAYVEGQKGSLFFCEQSDEVVAKFKAKISAYKAKQHELEEEIKAKVIEINK